jgi:hypothetical protein
MDNPRKLLRELGWKIQGVSERLEGIWGKYREISNRRTRENTGGTTKYLGWVIL